MVRRLGSSTATGTHPGTGTASKVFFRIVLLAVLGFTRAVFDRALNIITVVRRPFSEAFMSRRSFNSLALAAILAGTVAGVPASGQQDGAKRSAEFPVQRLMDENNKGQPGKQGSLFANPARSMSMRDMSKGRIEMPVKSLFIEKFKAQPDAGQEPSTAVRAVPSPALLLTKNPVPGRVKVALPSKTLGTSQKPALKPQQEKVEPGKVRWHKAIQTAMDASRRSGKPVLLFQMMGHLDDRFC